ncbi:MAG: general secretion pathway protein GspF [Gammaproteobacteria bacterium]|nr:general secretion pathway protein GspF [Gammaproteobacteria bacterium]NNF61783.1 general secretion pathway protein GspF [Gammaproteobacteria bacterium]NNM20450.1 general secretion pathway protein GspF [Gammaproteobacteria bacterium]
MAKKHRALRTHEALVHDDHARPMTRRDFLGRGLLAGAGVVAGPSVFGLFANPRAAHAALSPDIETLRQSCGIAVQGAGKIPFICFDLAGGANIAGSNVLTGGAGGQLDFLTTAGYSKLGLPGDMVPSIVNPQTGTNDFVDSSLGLAFHTDSAFLRGMVERLSPATLANLHGAVIPARSDNDTGNNPHNPMYGIYQAGADGELLTLIGSRSSDSGGNSMTPDNLLDPSVRPTKVDRASDVTGLVDTGKLVGLLDQADAVAVMESIQRISDMKLNAVNTGVTQDDVIKELVRCGYVKAADLSDRFGDPSTLDPELDTDIIGSAGIFSQDEYDSESQFRKTAAVMKLVVNGFAGAGTIEMGGFDYHTGERGTGERRDLLAGRCMGACLEYAARVGVPLMLYVFSDGSVSSNGRIDESVDGRGKGEWTGDNSSTAASFFMVYNPNGQPVPFTGDSAGPERHIQIGHFRPDGSVETAATPAAGNVNLLVETVILNYLALHGQQDQMDVLFPQHGLGNATLQDSLTAFDPIVNGTI